MKKCFLFLLLSFQFFSNTSLEAQWTKVWSDSWAQKVKDFGTISLMASGRGVMKSTDQGSTWTSANTGLPAVTAIDFAKLGDNLFVAMNGYGLYKSNNDGASWQSCNLVGAITTLKTFEGKLFVGFNDFSDLANKNLGILMSKDSGKTFSPISRNTGNIQGEFVWELSFDGTYLYNASEGGIFRTADLGVHWEALSVGKDLPGEDSRSCLSIGNILLWSTSSTQFRSIDQGTTWEIIDTDHATNMLSLDNIVFMSSGFGVKYSTDFGRTWSDFSNDLPVEYNSEIDVIGTLNGKICLGTNTGLYVKNLPITNVQTQLKSKSLYINGNQLELPSQSDDNNQFTSVEIFNQVGKRELYFDKLPNSIDLNSLNNGIYFLKLNGTNSIIEKFIVNNK